MCSLLKRCFLVLAISWAATSAQAFSLLGPFAAWQVQRISYDAVGSDIGGPMNLGEEYRWNLKTIYFGFDESFLNYFGTEGTNAVIQAIAIMNALPPTSQMSSNLAEFPLNTTRENPTATALGLVDLKSYTLSLLVEEVGLASPSRYTWTLRNRQDSPLVYTIVKRNFDPVTLSPSSFVNGTLYTFTVQEFPGPNFADAVELILDPDPFKLGFTAVADGVDGLFSSIGNGQYYTGLTRDDVGGLRYLYRTNNFQYENLISNATAQGSSDPWFPVGGTNSATSNAIVNTAIRAGVDKLTFKMGKYDSFVGSFIVTTNAFVDAYVTNSGYAYQNVQRVLTVPDILFGASDLPLAGPVPGLVRRTDTTGWANNDAINGQIALDGPGVIQPQVIIEFSKVGPYFFDQAPPFEDLYLPIGGSLVSGSVEASVGFRSPVWGSFDGRTNAPIIYPIGTSIYEYENQVLTGGGGGGSPYSLPDTSGIVITNTP